MKHDSLIKQIGTYIILFHIYQYSKNIFVIPSPCRLYDNDVKFCKVVIFQMLFATGCIIKPYTLAYPTNFKARHMMSVPIHR